MRRSICSLLLFNDAFYISLTMPDGADALSMFILWIVTAAFSLLIKGVGPSVLLLLIHDRAMGIQL